MLKGLTSDVMEIEELSPEEAEQYEEGFEEMRNGQYVTFDEIVKARLLEKDE
jgi:hypothetical protein